MTAISSPVPTICENTVGATPEGAAPTGGAWSLDLDQLIRTRTVLVVAPLVVELRLTCANTRQSL